MGDLLPGGAVLAKLLKKGGVEFVFGLPGGQLFPFMDAVSREEGMRILTTRHEENSAHMADAVSRLTGKPAACFSTVGPGAANMVPGVAAAFADSIPVVAITPNNQTFCTYPAKGSIQDGNHLGLYRSITKWNAMVNQRERLPELVLWALREATTGCPGPVHLDIPVDVMYKTFSDSEYEPGYSRSSGRVRGDAKLITRAAELLSKARRPLLLAGGGVVRAEAWDEFRALAVLGIPATTTPMGHGCVDPNGDRYIGSAGWLGGSAVHKALQEADVVLAVGCRFSGWLGLGKPPVMGTPGTQKVIHVDIDPSRIGLNVPVEVGIVSDAKVFLADLLELLKGRKLQVDEQWFAALIDNYKKYMIEMEKVAAMRSDPLNEATVAKLVADFLDAEAIVAFDGGQVMEWAHTFVKINNPRNKLFTAGMGHLGMGMPFANAAKLVHPDRQVVNITGDGAFALTCQELETAVRYNLPVVNIIFNDRAWGMIKAGQVGLYNNPVGTDFFDTDYAEVARGFGAYGERVTRAEEIKPALQRAFAAGKPAVIDIITQFTPHPVDRFWVESVLAGCELPVPAGNAEKV